MRRLPPLPAWARLVWATLTAASLGALGAAPRAAAAQVSADSTLFAVNNTTTLYTVNRLTGVATSVGTITFASSGMARDPATGRVYYASTNSATPIGRIAYWDPATSTNTTLNSTGNGDNLIRMAFSRAGVLYALGGGSASGASPTVAAGQLWKISTTTGAETSLGTVHVGSTTGVVIPNSGDMAFDPDGTCWVVATSTASTSTTSLYKLDVTTLVATEVGTVGTFQLAALAVTADGTLLGGSSSNNAMYAINRTTGAGTLVATSTIPLFDFANLPHYADISVTVSSAGLTAGLPASYGVTVSNAGPDPATGTVTVVDTLPSGVTYTGVSGTGWSCAASGAVVTCTTPGPLASSATKSFTLSVSVAAGAAGTLTDVARVQDATADIVPSNNRATYSGAVTTVGVAVTPDGAAASQLPSHGTSYTQIFTVTNTGSAADTFNLALASGAAGHVAVTSVNGVAGTAATLPIAAGANAALTVVYTVADTATAGSAAKLTATAASRRNPAVTDPGDLTVTVVRAGLTIVKAAYLDDQTTPIAATNRVLPGQYVQYKVTVTSVGTSGAVTVHIVDPLPTQLSFTSAFADAVGWTISTAAGTLTADLAGTLAAGQSRYFWLRARVQ